MTDRLLLDAARLLEREAASIKDANWVDGAWFDDEPEQQARADHDEMVEVARLLRARAKERA